MRLDERLPFVAKGWDYEEAMPKRSSKKATEDPNVIAMRILRAATNTPSEEPKKDPLAVELGRRGGLKGGKARAAKLSARKRKEIARKAARSRWGRSQ